MSDPSFNMYIGNRKMIHAGDDSAYERIIFYAKLLKDLGEVKPAELAEKTAERVKKLEAMATWVKPFMDTNGNLEEIITGHQRELKTVSNNLRLAYAEIEQLKEQLKKGGT